MQKYQELKVSFDKITDMVCKFSEGTRADEVHKYLLSMILRIWSCNGLYAEEYGITVNTLMETDYTRNQIMTAMACCGEEARKLLIPSFIKEMNQLYLKKDIINHIGDYLAAAALINGDFTTEEAACWTSLMDDLTEECLQKDAAELDFRFKPKDHVTPLNKTGYYKNAPKEHVPLVHNSDDVVIKNEEQNAAVNDLIEKVDRIVDAIKIVGQDSKNEMEQARVDKPSDKSLDELLAELKNLVGLDKVKSDVRSLMNFIKVANLRKKKGLKIPAISYHLVFTGNPGTGKTTIARLIAQIYYKMGLLTKGQLVETDRSALVAGYHGQTAIKTQKVIQEALGGVLFIDEAYALAGEGEDSYGKEAIETLLKGMEDHREDLVVIVAGYDELMQKFINSNPGLRSRFNKFFHFPDYTGKELTQIFERFCESNGYAVSDENVNMLLEQFAKIYETREIHFGNARAVRNVFETAICCQANRIAEQADLSEEALIVLTKEDLQLALKEEFEC